MAPLRITVAGKGGTGKTVVAAVLARALARQGRSVLAVDTDDNPMLAISLGVPISRLGEPQPIPTDFWRAVERPGEGRAAILVEHPQTLAQRHGIPGPDGVTLLAAPVVPNRGCTSDGGVRGMLGVLLGTHLFERVITDFEAGVDEPAWALGGLLNPADVLLVLATPAPVAIATARKIANIAREAAVRRVYGIANQVRTEAEAEAIRRAFAEAGLECLATVPYDEAILAADVRGASPLDEDPRSPGVAALVTLASRLEQEAAIGAE